MTGDEMVGWHHGFNGHELEQTPGDGEGQESLEYCSLWGHKESNLTWRLNNSSKKNISNVIRVVTAPSPPNPPDFSNELTVDIRRPMYWSFHFTIESF